ncbi:nitroreductase family protein [Robiginitalea sp.]|uniref:nitroreductase family protein n=1 Tax=Robiginitalea sp. TaxID=1902411 RepID=UPI003C75D8C6
MEQTINSLYWRYAVKKFDPDRILPDGKIRQLGTAFNLTATSYGLQPIRLLIVQNKEIQKSLISSAYGQQQVADASHLLVICIEKKMTSGYIEAYFKRVQEIRGTEEDILQPFKKGLVDTFAKMTPDDIRNWAINQAYLALGNLLTVCAVERIDSCPMEGFVPAGFEEILELGPKQLEPVLLLPVGYRSATDMFSGFAKVRRAETESVLYHK